MSDKIKNILYYIIYYIIYYILYYIIIFNDIINMKNFDPNNIKIDETSNKNIVVYYI